LPDGRWIHFQSDVVNQTEKSEAIDDVEIDEFLGMISNHDEFLGMISNHDEFRGMISYR